MLHDEGGAGEAGAGGDGDDLECAEGGGAGPTVEAALFGSGKRVCVEPFLDTAGEGQADEQNGGDDGVGELEAEVKELARGPEEDDGGGKDEGGEELGLAEEVTAAHEAGDHDTGTYGGGGGAGEPDIEPNAGDGGEDTPRGGETKKP